MFAFVMQITDNIVSANYESFNNQPVKTSTQPINFTYYIIIFDSVTQLSIGLSSQFFNL